MKKSGHIFGICIGVCMIVMWTMLLLTGQAVELKTEPYRIIAHISSELITALLLIIGGLASIKKKYWGSVIHFVSLGALLYSVLTAGGYYLQKGDAAMTIMFGVFFIATCVFIAANFLNVVRNVGKQINTIL